MESLKIEHYMNHYPVTFTADMNMQETTLRFLKTKQIGGPVIDVIGKLVGFVSESDVMVKMLDSMYYNDNNAKVKDIMRKDVLSVKPYDSVLELAQTMLEDRPKVYPVIDDDGELLGTICRNDVLKAFDRHMRMSLSHAKEHAAN
jgi:predicted transcriptional regulator